MNLQDVRDEVVLSLEEVTDLSMRVLTLNGLSHAQAQPLARAMALAERDD